ncbi:outer membrane beta-barrel protein [Geothrix sp. SG200]|uniref:outer membrane beta-barrel protein n=1 Tax=Geothrix sp. SG200 TaxID=2922865 RepID=UPI001FADF21B|nr:outer membrane beta-barrel protein [Geothrix sp. SG200]
MNLARTCLLGLLALPALAQSSPFSVGGGLILGLDSYKKAVNSSTGFTLNAGYDTNLLKSGVPARISFGLSLMPGKETNGLKTSLTLYQLAGDILVDTGARNLRGVIGLSLNSYTAKFSGQESPAVYDVDHHFPFHDAKGLKGGLRLGLEYATGSHWSGQVLLQTTELSGRDRNDPLIRRGGINPAWLEFGVRYRF